MTMQAGSPGRHHSVSIGTCRQNSMVQGCEFDALPGCLSPKGPRPFFCEKILKTVIFVVKSKKNLKIVFFAHLTVGSYT